MARNRLTYPVLSDPGNGYARMLSLVFSLPNDVRAVYSSFGIDLEKSNGDPSWELPMPARVVVDREGIIRHVDVDPDYRRRPEPTATLDVLRTLG